MAKREAPPLTEGRLFAMLTRRYAAPTWALFGQVPDHGTRRRCISDAVAVACWESRGLEVHGFEIKVGRHDWLRELKKPAKSVPVQQFCDRWWIVAAKGVVDLDAGELPPAWGLLVPRGRVLVTVVKAPKLEAKPLTRGFVAGVLRRAYQDTHDSQVVAAIREEVHEELAAQIKTDVDAATQSLQRENKRLEAELSGLREAEERAGCRIHKWNLDYYAALAEMLRSGGVGTMENRLRRIVEGLEDTATRGRTALQELGELAQKESA